MGSFNLNELTVLFSGVAAFTTVMLIIIGKRKSPGQSKYRILHVFGSLLLLAGIFADMGNLMSAAWVHRLLMGGCMVLLLVMSANIYRNALQANRV